MGACNSTTQKKSEMIHPIPTSPPLQTNLQMKEKYFIDSQSDP